ncbi:MAG: alpha/beta fold hydrolase [Christensenellales bacterium]|jgi:pimeloyl-ACP methyl ester carboxylesterase
MRKNGHMEIGDTEMYYVSFGNGKKNLIVLPGLSDGLSTVKGKAWLLASPYKCFLRDYTVYIFSRKNAMPEGYTIKDMANDQVQAMKSMRIDKAYILGVSQGGMIAQYIAIEHPGIVEKLILAVTAPNANDTVKEAVSNWIDMAKRGNHTALMLDTAKKTYSERYIEKNRRYLPVLAKLTKPKNYDRFYKNACAILGYDARSELSAIRCPTLIIAGKNDHIVGQDAHYDLNTAIAGSELFVYDGLGHGAFEEAEDFYDRVLEFCNR